MSTLMLRRERQDHAASIMIDAAREITEDRIREYLKDYGGDFGPEDIAAIQELAETSDITVEWSEIAYEDQAADR